MQTNVDNTNLEIVDLSPNEGHQLFEERVQDLLGISTDEFLRRWDAGELDDLEESTLVELSLLIPLVRQDDSKE